MPLAAPNNVPRLRVPSAPGGASRFRTVFLAVTLIETSVERSAMMPFVPSEDRCLCQDSHVRRASSCAGRVAKSATPSPIVDRCDESKSSVKYLLPIDTTFLR